MPSASRRRCRSTTAASWSRPRTTWPCSTRRATSARGRRLPEPTAAPLVWADRSGSWWSRRRRRLDVDARRARARRASAASARPIDGGAALADDHTLVAVVARARRTSPRSTSSAGPPRSRAVAPGGLWLGPPTCRARTRASSPCSAPRASSPSPSTPPARARPGVLPATRASSVAGRRRELPIVGGLTAPLLVDAAGTLAFVLRGGVGRRGATDATRRRRRRGPRATARRGPPGRLPPGPPGCSRRVLGGAPPPVAGLAPLPPGVARRRLPCRARSVAVGGARSARTSGGKRATATL